MFSCRAAIIKSKITIQNERLKKLMGDKTEEVFLSEWDKGYQDEKKRQEAKRKRSESKLFFVNQHEFFVWQVCWVSHQHLFFFQDSLIAFLAAAYNGYVASSISHKMAILCRVFLFLANHF